MISSVRSATSSSAFVKPGPSRGTYYFRIAIAHLGEVLIARRSVALGAKAHGESRRCKYNTVLRGVS